MTKGLVKIHRKMEKSSTVIGEAMQRGNLPNAQKKLRNIYEGFL